MLVEVLDIDVWSDLVFDTSLAVVMVGDSVDQSVNDVEIVEVAAAVIVFRFAVSISCTGEVLADRVLEVWAGAISAVVPVIHIEVLQGAVVDITAAVIADLECCIPAGLEESILF